MDQPEPTRESRLDAAAATRTEDSKGRMSLYDYYKPSLYPGLYGIEAKQTIIVPNQNPVEVFNYNSINPATEPPPIALQNFTVIASQFRIDPKVVNSIYPPNGHAEEGRVLPHIVFNDPHLPWERPPFPPAAEEAFAQKPWPPWMALVVFDPKELRIDSHALARLRMRDTARYNPHSGSYSMSVHDYLSEISSRPDYEKGYQHDLVKYKQLVENREPVDVIFPSQDIINESFKNPAKFKYMCHVRKLDTDGLPDAKDADNGLYSICVSHRSGPIMSTSGDPSAPRTQTVHLVSIECLVDKDGNLAPPANVSGSNRIGLVSLYSWTYLATPPSPNNFITTLRALADKKQPLMPPRPILDAMVASSNTGNANQIAAAKQLQVRLTQGYSITRWRPSTGEETVSFNRGPLTPISLPPTPTSATDWPNSSNSGKDYQILDKSTGLMDLTYSSAWQLGRLLAIADTVFSTAMLRFRSIIHQQASNHVRMFANEMIPAKDLVNGASRTVEAIEILTNGSSIPTRVAPPPTAQSVTTLTDGSRHTLDFHTAIHREVKLLAGMSEVLPTADIPSLSQSPDFEVIKNWITDKLFLSGIPAHYLIIDPSDVSDALAGVLLRGQISLPSEALRFFYVDDAWMDCFIDGALSIANHLDPVEDTVRRSIKEVYNTYLIKANRPIPRYGFILRSSVVKAIPDLRVNVTCRIRNAANTKYVKDKSRDPLIKLTKMNDTTLLALLDCFPEDILSIIIAQPAHQQRYVAPIPPAHGAPYLLKRLYTEGAPEKQDDDETLQDTDGTPPVALDTGTWPDIPEADVIAHGANVGDWYNALSRSVNIERMTRDLEVILPFDAPPAKFKASVGSAALALQLNDKAYQLEISPPPSTSPSGNRRLRQLWLGFSAVSTSITAVTRSFVPSLEKIRPVLRLRDASESKRLAVRAFTSSVFSVRIIPGPRITLPSIAEPPLGPLNLGRYLLSIHPSYRPAAPLPFTNTVVTPPSKIFSAHDYLPTQATRLLDLVFSLQRNLTGVQSGRQVTSLTIIIPTTAVDGTHPPAEEQLLNAPYNGIGASMLHNRRLTPLLVSAPGQLQVTLVPRNAIPGQVLALSNEYTREASFVLKGCSIAATTSKVQVEVMGAGNVERGLAKVGLIERYKTTSGATREASYVIDVVKKDGVEKRVSGEVV